MRARVVLQADDEVVPSAVRCQPAINGSAKRGRDRAAELEEALPLRRSGPLPRRHVGDAVGGHVRAEHGLGYVPGA
jgi:hypothetical protein